MNADDFNRQYPVGTLVFAYPGFRPEDDATARRLVTRTRTAAQVSAPGDPVVWVEGEGSYICLTHVDPVSEDVWEEARAAEKPADTPKSTGAPKTVREKVAGLLWWSVPSGTDEEAKAQTSQLLDELAAEARAESAAELAAVRAERDRARSAAFAEAADLAVRYGAGAVEQAVLRDLATELRSKAREAS
ncbi:hypothetical protein [Streptomyces lancefieldiae]|uniref:Uncharacterized protein n=1 Tax=Streptomyces lancefieldiae TaxID=3075520 RepID=A0ABU3AIQ5_9ACTN|nr:hypothetical protein [Streptomyces sp. DSM 40712]MDT0608776.1 hypothetical protein [Streptomyces sp. DSM 40712]